MFSGCSCRLGASPFIASTITEYDKWEQLAILTIILFGYLLKWGWHYKKQAKFWGLYLTAFVGHCAVFVTVFSYGALAHIALGRCWIPLKSWRLRR